MRKLVLPTAICAGLVLTVVSAGVALATECDSGGWAGNCVMSNETSHVDVSVSQGGSSGKRSDDRDQTPRTPGSTRESQESAEPVDCGPLNRCGYSVGGPPEVTLSDLASFRPAEPVLGGEPSGFGVVGMPTNLVASASEQRIAGTVLGWDVTVRFMPVAYVFDHGDGTTARTASGGSSWADLGLGQFSPTATSHVFVERGTYDVSVTVEYAASVDFGSGTWRPVPGVVRADASGYGVRVVEVRSALVERTCAEDPVGPGC